MIRRTCCCTQMLHLLYQEWQQSAFVLNGCFGHWVEVGLVSRTTTFGNHYETVFSTFNSLDINLCREVTLGVYLVIHVQRSILRITQVVLCISVEHTKAQRLFVLESCPYLLTFLAMYDGRTRILTEGQHTLTCCLGITKELQSYIFVVL